jgi:hypothetical protein
MDAFALSLWDAEKNENCFVSLSIFFLLLFVKSGRLPTVAQLVDVRI